MHRLIVWFVFMVCVASGGKELRMWEKEEIHWRRVETLQETKEKQTKIVVHSTLTSLSVEVDGRQIWYETLPYHNRTLDTFGKYASVVVIVLSTVSRRPTIVATRKFMTGQPTEDHKLIVFLKGLQKGRLAILVGTPNFLAHMNLKVRRELRQMGSTYITQIDQGDSWVMAWLTEGDPGESMGVHLGKEILGRKNLMKTRRFLYYLEMQNHNANRTLSRGRVLAESVVLKDLAYQRNLSVSFDLDLDGEASRCKWRENADMEAQAAFCDAYDGYDTLCSCQAPFIPRNRPKPAAIPMTEDIPIVIVTANKPFHLYRLFRNLELVRGAAETKILVVIDGYHLETMRLCRLFRFNFRIHQPQGNPRDNTRTNMNIGFSLWAAFDHFITASKIILLEDDLLLSPDLLSFFHQTHHLLDEDESLSHINAFGQNSYSLTAANPLTLLRVEMYPQYGWLTTRRWFQNISSHWVREGNGVDWDWWLSTEGERMKRHSVVPEVSRTGHAGSAGAHVSGYAQVNYFHTRIQTSFTAEMPIVDTQRISSAENYQQWIDSEIRRSTKLWLTDSPCAYNIFPANKTGPFVLFLGVSSKADGDSAFALLQTCLGTDETDLKELYDGIMRVNALPITRTLKKAKERHVLYLVGCPLSSLCDYSRMMSDWIIPRPSVLVGLRSSEFWRRNVAL